MVLYPQHHGTAGVDLGANQGHAGGLTVPLVVILERPQKKVHTHAKGSRQAFENDANCIRLLPGFQFTNNSVAHTCLPR
jgi:hypothetical protein